MPARHDRQAGRRDHHEHLTTFQLGELFHLDGIGQIVGPPLVAWLLVRAPSQAQGFDLALSVAAGALVLGAVLYGFIVWRWRPVR